MADVKRSRTHPSLETSASRRVTDYDSVDARSTDRGKSARGVADAPRKLGEFDQAIKRPSTRGTSGASPSRRAEASSRKTEPGGGHAALGADKFDRVEGRDLTKAAYRTVGGKMRGGVRRSRNIGRSAEYPIAPGGRDERGDAPYKSGRKRIKRDAEEPSWDRSEKSGPLGTRFEEGVNRLRRKKKGMESSDVGGDEIDRRRKNVSRSRRKGADYEEEGKIARSVGRIDDSMRKRGKAGRRRSKKIQDAESIYGDQSNRERKELGGKRGRKLYKSTVPENQGSRRVEKTGTSDTDDEEKTTGGRGRRTPRREKAEEMEEMADVSKSKKAGRRSRKKADAFDSEKGGVSRSGDEEGDVLKRDGKRRGRSSERTEGIDSDLMKKYKRG